MRENNNSWYDRYRVQDIFRHRPASDQEIALAVKYFKEGTTTDLRLARKFDTYYSYQEGSEPVEQIVPERAKTWARGTLEHDPYNLEALEILLTSSFDVTVQASGGTMMTPTGSPTKNEKRDYLRRRVLAPPYNAEFRDDLASTLYLSNTDLTAEKILAAADMRTNAIACSNHSPEALLDFIYQKLRELKLLDSWEETAGVRVQPDLDPEKVYACPLIRSTRLLEYILETGAPLRRHSEMSEETVAQLADIRAAAESGEYCDWERNAPLEDLIFEPVEVELSLIN